MILLVLAACAVLAPAWLLYGLRVAAALRRVVPLSEALAARGDGRGAAARDARPPGGRLLSLSAIVTARNEAAGIESTIRSLLAQDYPGLQIIAVDDRSADGTAEILDRLEAEEARARRRLRVIHNHELPQGWLGKCHACHLAAQGARGEWLLFMDGDVTLARSDLLTRILEHAGRQRLDHVALLPDLRPMSALQSALVLVFYQAFLLGARSYEMERDRRRGGAGVGAFNLVRRAAYERIGGHRTLRLDPLDDFKLGILLKESGARQRLYDGVGLVRCPWLSGTLNLIRGLEKNFFPSLDYSLARLLAVTLLALGMALGPLAAAVSGTALSGSGGPALLAAAWLPLLLQAAFQLDFGLVQGRRHGAPPWLALLFPLGVLFLVAAAWNSALKILARRGVSWRDTFYPLSILRRGLVRPGAARSPAGSALPEADR